MNPIRLHDPAFWEINPPLDPHASTPCPITAVAASVFSNPDVHPMSREALRIITGIDTRFYPGKKIRSLALDSVKRREFFSERQDVEMILKKHPFNPLLEEGNFDSETGERDREGEYFLTFEAMKELLENKLKNNPRYKVNNLIILDNNRGELERSLEAIDLDEGENILIAYFSDIHAIAAYIQKIGGELRYQIIDSEPTSGHTTLKNSIESVFPGIKGRVLSEQLQTDYYSCSTFVIKSLMFFGKYGRDMLERADFAAPAPLLKMAQRVDFAKIESERLSQIVSQKKQLTLSEYLKIHMQDFGGRSYNTAALTTRYRYIDRLHRKFTERG